MIEEPVARCPDSETLARGASGELPLAERRALATHLTSCDACADLLRLWPDLRAWAERSVASVHPAPEPRSRSGQAGPWILAAAAVLVIGVGLVSFRNAGPTEAPSFRAPDGADIRSLVPPDRPLSRSEFRLRWTPGPPGSRYAVLVAREDLTRIARVQGLAAPEYLVEAPLLSGLPEGTRIVWSVEASAPGESPALSPVFLTALE